MSDDLFHEHIIHVDLIDAGEVIGTIARPSYEEDDDVTETLHELPPELAAALTRKAENEADIAATIAHAKRLELDNVLASNDANRVLVIDGPIIDMDGGVSVDECRATLMRWTRRDPGQPITIYMNTPGGSIFDGNALIHTIKELKNKGHVVTIIGQGTVMSLGSIILQVASPGERVLDKDTVFMIHSLQSQVFGSFEGIQDTTEMLKGVQDRHLNLLVSRCNLTKTQLKNKIKRKDWFISADEALKNGFCDRVE